jgi:hypothetical protein
MEIAKEILWYGSSKSLPEPTLLRAGEISLFYQEGNLRNICIGNVEVIRMIYVAVRDRNWRTVKVVIEHEHISKSETGFQIDCHCIYRQGEIDIHTQLSISGDEHGTINLDLNGQAANDFYTNRIGFCVLHPIESCQGKSCEVINPNGAIKHHVFPKFISPHQPMKNISEMSWQVADQTSARLVFSGEVFEMEDQRNWTDDSYKTYSRPLELPFPFHIKNAEEIQQKINLMITGEIPDKKSESGRRLYFNTEVKFPVPKMGIQQASRKFALSPEEKGLIHKIAFDFYEVQVSFEDSWIADLVNVLDDIEALDLDLRLRVLFSDNYQVEIRQLSNVLENYKARIQSLLVLQHNTIVTSDESIYKLIETLSGAFPNCHIGAGTLGSFAELNRNRILSKDIDFLSYSITPQVHAFDNLSLVENLVGQSATVDSAKSFAEERSIHAGPVTLKMQMNPAATTSSNNEAQQIDARQMSLFGAGWTLGSIKYLSQSGVAGITYYEAVGEKGIIQGDDKPLHSETFPVDKGAIFPMYYIFQEVLSHKKGHILFSESSHPTEFEGIVFEQNGKRSYMLANFTNKSIEVEVEGIDPGAKVRKLDEKNVISAMYESDKYLQSPYCDFKIGAGDTTIKIRPYGLVIINE